MGRHAAKITAIYEWLRESGGSRDANVNGSSTAVVFDWEAEQNHALIHRLIVTIIDAGTFDATLYGNRLELPNGMKVEVIEADGTVLDLLGGHPIHSNSDWAAMCHDFGYIDIGTGDNVATIRWTFSRAGLPLVLHAGDRFVITVQDDLTDLSGHHFYIQGHRD